MQPGGWSEGNSLSLAILVTLVHLRIPSLSAVVLVLAVLAAGLWWQTRPSLPVPQTPRYPSEWGWLQRTYPHFQAAPDAYRTALRQARVLAAKSGQADLGTWQPVGPTNIGGRISDVAFHPSEPSTLFAAAATGGLFKSTDNGQTWQPLFDAEAILNIGDFALDPTNPDILYVGTGEANGGHNNFAGGGVYKSTDGGQTWQFQGLEATVSIGRILVDPTNPQRVWVAAVGSYFAPNPERGVYRSDDGGQHWTHVLAVNDSTGVIDLVQHPDDPQVLFAATWERVRRVTGARLSGPGSGIYRSNDGGTTWTHLANGLPAGAAGRIGLAICRSQPDVLYALYTDGTALTGLYRSDDGGQRWRVAATSAQLVGGTGGFSWYMGQVRVHPANPDLVYILDVQLMRSTNGGLSWSFAGFGGLHADHHALDFHPDDPDRLLDGHDGGLSQSYDAGLTWTPLVGLPVTQFYEIALDPTDANRRYGGTQDNGTLHSEAGQANDWVQIFGGDGFYVNLHPTNPNILYVEWQNGNLQKSVDGGRTFVTAMNGIGGEKRNWSTPVVMDPTNPQVLYYGTNRLYRTADGAASWQAISGDLTKQTGAALLGTVTTIAVAPTNPNLLYAGTDDGNVWRSEDGGTTWQNVTGGLPDRWVTRLAPDPTNDRVVYATFSGLRWRSAEPHVFRSTDRGQTWQDISANLPDAPVNAFAVDPRFPQLLYLGSDVGVFVSLDTGATWQPLGDGLPAVAAYDLKVHLLTNQLFAGTHGRSMYALDLTTVQAAVATEVEAVPAPMQAEAPWPNPFRDQSSLRLHLDQPGTLTVEVFDVQGRPVRTLFAGPVGAHTHTFTWDGRDAQGRRVASGRYFARVRLTSPATRVQRTFPLTLLR